VSGQQHAPAALYPRKEPAPILQEAGWAPGPVWTGGKSCPYRDSIPDLPARSQSLYRLSYPAHNNNNNNNNNRAGIALSVQWLGCNIRVSNPDSRDFLSSPNIQAGPGPNLTLIDWLPEPFRGFKAAGM